MSSQLQVDQIVSSSGGAIAAPQGIYDAGSGTTTTSTELSYVHGTTSAIQTQLDGKSPLAGPGSGQAFSTGALTATGVVSSSSYFQSGHTGSAGIYYVSRSSDGGLIGGVQANGNNVELFNGAGNGAGVVASCPVNFTGAVSTGALNVGSQIVAPGISCTDPTALQVKSGSTIIIQSNANGAGTVANSAITILAVCADSVTGRSLSAGGTVNASGADYAEYETKADSCGTVAKGQIVGFDVDGKVTDKWAEAISFGVKSTNPNLVGGDTWGNEDAIGKRPEQPVYQMPAYTGSPDPGPQPTESTVALPPQPTQQEGETAETFAVRTAAWQAASAQHAADQATYAATVQAAETTHAAAMTQYQTDLAAFEAKLEAERQKVDRVAYSGKVPVNVTGAKVGDYIVAVQSGDGITGEAVTDPTFDQYRMAVGRVRSILADGRAEIAVIVH